SRSAISVTPSRGVPEPRTPRIWAARRTDWIMTPHHSYSVMSNNIQDMSMPQVAPQVGIVLVSQSVRLAEGAADLAAQVGGWPVTVAAAGGTDDGGLGTSAAKVERALGAAEAGAGVLVLPDLGSAVLTVRALLADLPDAEEAVAALIGILGDATRVGG